MLDGTVPEVRATADPPLKDAAKSAWPYTPPTLCVVVVMDEPPTIATGLLPAARYAMNAIESLVPFCSMLIWLSLEPELSDTAMRGTFGFCVVDLGDTSANNVPSL